MKKKGFTLFEILIVIALISLVYGFFVPSFSGSSHSRKLRTEVIKVQGILKESLAEVKAGRTIENRHYQVNIVFEDNENKIKIGKCDMSVFLCEEFKEFDFSYGVKIKDIKDNGNSIDKAIIKILPPYGKMEICESDCVSDDIIYKVNIQFGYGDLFETVLHINALNQNISIGNINIQDE